jgi:uncharacterized membrane protein
MTRKIKWFFFAFLAICIGLYPLIYLNAPSNSGLFATKPAELLINNLWNLAFYTHLSLGGLALLIGWAQFSPKWRKSNPKGHRVIGKIYAISVLISAICSIYIGIHATGGTIAKTGFISLGIIWLFTTIQGYRKAKSKEFSSHKKWMTYSYAACFAAVTLRLWMPILIAITGDFISAYQIVAWLCWVPNLLFAKGIAQ